MFIKGKTIHFLGDRELVQQLVFDAWVTESFSIEKFNKDEKSNEKASEKG